MKLLILTQKVHKDDDVLGFFHNWIEHLARVCEEVTVIALEQGKTELPSNVRVFSLGKEKRGTRAKYVLNFYRCVLKERHRYDAVFVHMNIEYVLLGAIVWKFFGVPVALWYNHTFGSKWARMAFWLADVVMHTSPYAYSAGTKKSVRMPAGIDTRMFNRMAHLPRLERSVVYVGRIAPVKKVDVLIKAIRQLKEQGEGCVLHVYGSALPRDRAYEKKVRRIAGQEISFHGSIPNTAVAELFNKHAVFVNLTPRGNYDKTVLEAAACGALVLASSKAFEDFLPKQLRFEENDPRSLADKLRIVLRLPEEAKEMLRHSLREYVVSKHDIGFLTERIVAELSKVKR